METTDTASFYGKQASLFGEGLDAALESGNGELAVFNAGQVFKAYVMQGLITWRIGKNRARLLQRGVEAAQGVGQRINLSTLPTAALPLERSAIVATLIGVEHALVETNCLNADRLLDALIGNALLTTGDLSSTEVAEVNIQALPSSIAQRSYRLYIDLLAGSLAPEQGVRDGEELYHARKSDSFFSGGDEIEGGGEDNNLVVDYRLGAVLKKIGYCTDSIHAWKW
jgi:hypothetical protein